MRRLLFWSMGALIGWTYAGFPLVVLARARLMRRPVLAADISPPVTVVIAAHNEAAVIRRRVENLLAVDYPPDRLQIVIASDGSSDATVAIASSVAPGRVRVLDLGRVGKADAMNAAVAEATGEILVFSDANSEFAPDAIRRLTRHFADPAVGGVAGDQRYRADGTGADRGAGERQYWDIDRMLKQAESAAGNIISATGAIYAIRRELFKPIPAGVTDDFATSTAVIAQGRRLVFADDAIAYEPVARDDRAEFGRKVRVMTRGLRGVIVRRTLLDPRRHGFYAVQLATHKVLRRIVAFPLIGLAVVTPTLWRSGAVYQLAALGQVVAYGLAAVGLLLGAHPVGRRKVFALPAFFVWANVAAVQAVANLVRGHRIDRWDPGAARSSEVDEKIEMSPEALARRLADLAGPADALPDVSIVVPVNAQGDTSNVESVLGDISRYAGPRRLEVILVVNNYPPTEPPEAIARLEGMGARVIAVPNIRTHGEAPPFSARLPGVRAARSRAVITFDADCRIPQPTSLIDWYVDALAGGAPAAYTNVRYYALRSGLSIQARMATHHGSRWAKRVLLGIPTIRGSNYAVDRNLFLRLYGAGMLAEDMNVGPAMRKFGGPIPYSGDARHVVLTSGRMLRGGWRKLGRYLVYRLRSNLRVIPVHTDAASRTGREHEPVRRYVDNVPVVEEPRR